MIFLSDLISDLSLIITRERVSPVRNSISKDTESFQDSALGFFHSPYINKSWFWVQGRLKRMESIETPEKNSQRTSYSSWFFSETKTHPETKRLDFYFSFILISVSANTETKRFQILLLCFWFQTQHSKPLREKDPKSRLV